MIKKSINYFKSNLNKNKFLINFLNILKFNIFKLNIKLFLLELFPTFLFELLKIISRNIIIILNIIYIKISNSFKFLEKNM